VKKFFIIFIFLIFSAPVFAQEYEYEESENYEDDSSHNEDATDLLGEEPIENYDEPDPVKKKKPEEAPKNPNVPGEVSKWQLALNTSLINVNHCINANTVTTLGFPFSQTSLAAGYQISTQIWLMAKFHLFVNLANGGGTGMFLLGPGIRADFIRTDHISFFGGAFISIGSMGKIFMLSPELYAGIEYNVTSYFAIGVTTDLSYRLWARNGATHFINFTLGPQLTIYF